MANVSSSNGLEKRPKLRFPGFDEPWMTRKLGEMGTFIKGAPLSKADISDEGTPFILYGELYTTYSEVTNSVKRKTDKTVEHQFYSKIGDVIMPTSGETPEDIATASCIMIPDVILAGDLLIYRTEQIDGRFVSFCVKNKVNKQISSVAQGKSVVHVRAEELSKISVTFPALDEQQKILSLLESIDRRIATQQKLIETLKKYKRGLNRRLLSQIEESYNCKLGSVCKIIGGGTPDTLHGEYWGNSVEWFTPSEIGKTKYVNSSVRKLSNEGLSNSSAKLLPAGTVLLTTRATLGEMSIAEKECSTNQGFQSLIPLTSRVSSEYLYYMQIIIKPWCEKYSSGNTFREISKSALSECIIPVPEKPQQDKIVKLLSTVDTLIASEEKEASLLVQLKSSLLQQLFI
ncbi:restriction endonuclease subunit S [Clostridium porci]|uniref:Restriction endonuclease subunit S n=1 Tax=Clostridium porci TaxID=2605778 RepID=A0A7X2NPR3_9CLOT|nr:restriction endonuclease subunit S [Clostridium porci]MSS38263.1 restriction endonuclease subunit S [Clostridium porci]